MDGRCGRHNPYIHRPLARLWNAQHGAIGWEIWGWGARVGGAHRHHDRHGFERAHVALGHMRAPRRDRVVRRRAQSASEGIGARRCCQSIDA